MIRPTKHLDLDTCILHCAALVLDILRKESPLEYDSTLQRLKDTINDKVRFQFPYALDLLYLLGAIDYDLGTDTLYLTSGNTAQ